MIGGEQGTSQKVPQKSNLDYTRLDKEVVAS